MHPLHRKELAMSDVIKKILLSSIGLALKAWDEVEDLAEEFIKEGKMSEKEGRQFLKDLKKRYEETQKKMESRVEKSFKELLKKADVVTGDELKSLKKEIRNLKKMIDHEAEKK
jgi:polyhydroxyalkanoate synthesis regulator phasin